MLNSFVSLQHSNYEKGKIVSDEHLQTHSSSSDLFLPSPIAKAKLLMAIHEVEFIFIEFADDTIERVVQDLQSQM